ncbi:acyltransferase [Candidatus Nanohaloarchaea archaeon]|nr:acyltransferase [Candidatus Nanohaloarchaea archaeon]
MGRKDRLEIHEFEGKNSLRYWPQIFGVTSSIWRIVLVVLSKYMPLKVKNFLLRLTGADIGENVSIGFAATLDLFQPDRISIGDNTIIGYDTVILTHEALQDEMRTGPVKVGENVMLGTRSIVLPGVEIGDGAKISAGSLVNRDVEEGEFVGGTPIRNLEDREE